MLDAIARDVIFALRGLRAARVVSGVAVLSLAVGIGANTTIFTLVQALAFPHLIYPEASRLVFLESVNQSRGLAGILVSAPDAADIARSAHSLTVAVTADQRSVLRVGDTARRVSGRRVETPFFEVMRVPAQLGRTLGETDEPGVIVLADTLWRSAFGADPGVVGRAIRLDGGVVTVVGVMPAQFDADAEFWTPLGRSTAFSRDDRQFMVFGRLAANPTLADARRELAAISARLAGEHPGSNRDWVVYPTLLTELHGRDSRGTFLLLQAAVGCLLLIACANIANILLARGTRRRAEFAVRLSLGATTARVMRAALAEAAILSAAGGGLGLLLSLWGIRAARSLGGFPDSIDPHINLFVLLFTAALSIVTGVLCGLLPAWRAASVAPESVLREAGRGAVGDSKGRLRAALAAAQIAAALVLATCAALMVQTMANRERVDLGFVPDAAVRGEISLGGRRYNDANALNPAADAAIEHVMRQPGVAAAGVVTWALPTGAGGQRQFTLPGANDVALPTGVRRGVEAVSPRYFDAMGARLRAGRPFSNTDAAATSPVAIVNEELVRHLWPNRNPIGERLRLGTPAEGAPIVTVVGVVTTIRRSPMHEAAIARAYVPFSQYPNRYITLVARGASDAAAARALDAGIREFDPELLIEGRRTLSEDVAQFMAPIRLITVLLGGFGLTGVLLAALGVYGAISYTVSQRQRDLAVRSALGADRRALVGLVVGHAARISAAGVVAGVTAALAATRGLRAYLYGISPADPATYLTIAACLAAVALAAAYRPARIAATADPLEVLRQT